jgi:hypothetical protein
MMLKTSTYIKILLLLLLCGKVSAQSNSAVLDSIIKHADYYRLKKANQLMFVHLDKTVYVNNDVVWFAAYLLDVAAKDLPRHQVLSTALVNNNNQKVAAQGRFIMQMGLSYGDFTLPDTIPPGHYSFIAYTNRMIAGKPEISFVQPITVKSATEAAFNVELVLDTLYKDPATVRVVLNARGKNGPLDGAAINYYLGAKKMRVEGKAKTNVIGSYTLLLPKDHINADQHNLEVQVKSGTETKTLHLNIPVKKQVTDVKFYPEGGHLISGLPNKVGWELKTPGGTAIKTNGVLFADNKAIDTIATDSYGMGVFYLVPGAKVSYSVKLLDDNADNTSYNLPAALTNGIVMRMGNALVNDSLNFRVISNYRGKIHMVVHNYKQVFSTTTFNAQEGRYIKIGLSTIPRGLNSLTFLDSLQRPIAERLFFAHYNQKPKLDITMDDAEPGLRQKVHIKLKLNSITGKPASGVVSLACVQDNRFTVKNDNNIEHYVYLQSQLDNLPLKETLFGKAELDYQYLNELLLVRGWSKYKWPELMQSAPADTILKMDSLLFTGGIKHISSTIKKPVQLILMRDSAGINSITNSDKGDFTLENNQLYTQHERKIRMIVTGNSINYIINVNDPYANTNKLLAKNIDPILFDEPITQNTREFLLKGFEHATHLREVKIRPNDNGEMHGMHANACGDFVCRFHVLNCTRHSEESDNRPPQPGEMVYKSGIGISAYYGCWGDANKPGLLTFNGIYTAQEFYGADYTKINPTEPDYLSTICWKQGIILNPDKETDISFYTSDITGKFRIVVQGITNEDVVYGESSFVVKKKGP